MEISLKEEYGIEENQIYFLAFRTFSGIEDYVTGEILNFHPTQLVFKSEKGIYIIRPREIRELRPIHNKK